MDIKKRDALIAEFSGKDPILVPMQRFLDGNDDLGSIGCNLPKHPGIGAFRDAFAKIAKRPDVVGIYALISELDPGEGCWPFVDTVLVYGSIAVSELRNLLEHLGPDELGPVDQYNVPSEAKTLFRAPCVVAWWD